MADLSQTVEQKTTFLYFMPHTLLTILTAPYRRTFRLYTWIPLKELRCATVARDQKLLVTLIGEWQDDKYAELQSVQVAASFCAAATLSTISWNKIQNPHWVAEALWFTSLVCAIWAVITSIQTKSILDDLPDRINLTSSMPASELKRTQRVILRYKKTPGIGHWIMLFIWQFPSMMMSYAWCTYLSGLTVYVCTPFIRERQWTTKHNVAIVFLTVSGVGLITYGFLSIFVYVSEKDYERSVASTRISTNDNEPTEDPICTVQNFPLEDYVQDRSRRTSGRSKKKLLI
ncbi:hypothetical protein B0J11DRAFT_579515 [Dendryphion nanum]|uniref:Uncharacterized protein n=1 Tax=Dendryphion nanum TaxID=256645 RepID=A0A9P9IQ22_9PLEO|nr:hypothetical protein B0J11DRAFT_579515 [Dendryphion nanum]